MASRQSYKITKNNNRTEKEGIDYVLQHDPRLINPTKESRKEIMELLELPKTFSRAFDLIRTPDITTDKSEIVLDKTTDITLIELKTTKKLLPMNPKGFFFGATENEFNLAKRMRNQYLFCFVCLHVNSKSFEYLKLSEVEAMTRSKRVQFQINLQS